MEDKKLLRRRIIAIVLFVFALFLTEFSPFSGRAVALVNGGYGTFDMQKYDADVFVGVMNETSDFSIYWKYYLVDFIFVAAFLNFMIQMVSGFSGALIQKVKVVSYMLAVIRGMLDSFENIILLNQIYAFPKLNRNLIDACNMITRVKFHFMRGWIACFILMLILQIISNRKVEKKR